jgi:hypothetical protein
MASLAHVLLWLLANSSRRQSLSLGELPFVFFEGDASIAVRLTEEGSPPWGTLRLCDNDQQLEWRVSNDDLTQVALLVHRLASRLQHEYDRLPMPESSDAELHIRLTDLERWL